MSSPTEMAANIAEMAAPDPDPTEEVARVAARARAAMGAYENHDQERVDDAVRASGWAIYEPDRAQMLAELAVEDTGLGNAASKIVKNQRKTFGTLRDLLRAKTVRVIADEPERGMVKYGKPVGVVGAVCPSTNPAATPVNKAMMALKGGNAVIIAPSPSGATIGKTVELMRAELKKASHPEDLVQLLPPPVSKAMTEELVRQVDLAVVTGSQDNVRRAMQPGTVTIGVGAGNVPVIIDVMAEGVVVAAWEELKPGKQGTFWTKAMQDYGSSVVAGVNPKKARTEHLGVPIHASSREAAKETSFEIACMFIPPMMAKDAAIDTCEAGAKLLVCLTEHIPDQDVMEMHVAAAANGTRIVGPNTAGLVTVGECFVGIMPAFSDRVFRPGDVGVISRSESLGTLISLNLAQAGMRQSVFYGVGGDPMIGTTTAHALRLLDADEKTRAVVICGEIGRAAEEEAADYARGMKKPVVAFIAGRQSPPDKKMGHAGAIVSVGKGDYASKRAALEAAGVAVADVPSQIPVW